MEMADQARAARSHGAMGGDQGSRVDLEGARGIGSGVRARLRAVNGVARSEQKTANLARRVGGGFHQKTIA